MIWLGYYIHYGDKSYRTEIRNQDKRGGYGLLLCLIAVFIGFYLLAATGVKVMPGDPAVTKMAAENLISEIREGETAAEAFRGFCLEIICNE